MHNVMEYDLDAEASVTHIGSHHEYRNRSLVQNILFNYDLLPQTAPQIDILKEC